MESLLSEQQDWYWPGVTDQIRGLSGKGINAFCFMELTSIEKCKEK